MSGFGIIDKPNNFLHGGFYLLSVRINKANAKIIIRVYNLIFPSVDNGIMLQAIKNILSDDVL